MSEDTVSIEAEWLLKRLEGIENLLADIRTRAAEGVFNQPAHQEEGGSPFVRKIRQTDRRTNNPTEINIHVIEWMKKGMQPASADDSWAWAFTTDQEGLLRSETRLLVQEIERYKVVEIDGYEITLGGRDKNLLNRKKIKAKKDAKD